MNRSIPTTDPIAQRAVEWLSDLQDDKADPAALFAWLAESPRHVEEFAFMLTLSDDLAGLKPEHYAQLAKMKAPRAEGMVVALTHSTSRHPLKRSKIRERLTRPRLWIAAAAVAVLTVGISLGWNFDRHTLETGFGEQRMVELRDGSTLYLNTQSRVRVNYNEERRDIQLLSGEALFKVQRDPKRPFRVHSDGNVIQAIGTQFNVNRRATGTVVSVLEGSVRIATSGKQHPEQLDNLTVGQQVQLPRQGRVVKRQIDVKQAAAWRQHRLVFLEDSLADIAAEFNRYNRRPQVRIEDEDAARKRFVASFDADAPEALLQVLQTHPDLKVEYSDDEIRVYSRR